MNYHEPRQVDPTIDAPDAGKWRWTNRHRDAIYPEGYCSPIVGCDTCMGTGKQLGSPPPGFPAFDCPECDGKGYTLDPDRCPGHDTPEEAAEHYRRYCVDNMREVKYVGDPGAMDSRHRCEAEGCITPTDTAAEPGGAMLGTGHYLCDAHRNPEGLHPLVPAPGQIVASW